MLRLSDLPARAREIFLTRVAVLGLNPTPWEQPEGAYGWDRQPPNSFHGTGVGWRLGRFLYRSDAEVHDVAHEAGHAAQLDPNQWEALDCDDTQTSEDVSLIVQVELARGIRGLGTARMLSEMAAGGYRFSGLGDSSRDVSAAYWWRVVVGREMQEERVAADRIAAKWRAAQ